MRQSDDPIAPRLQLLEAKLEGEDHGATSRMARCLGVKFTTWHNANTGRGLSQKMLLTRTGSATRWQRR